MQEELTDGRRWHRLQLLEAQAPLPVVDALQLGGYVFKGLGRHDVERDVLLLRGQGEESARILVAEHAPTDAFAKTGRVFQDEPSQVIDERTLCGRNGGKVLSGGGDISLHLNAPSSGSPRHQEARALASTAFAVPPPPRLSPPPLRRARATLETRCSGRRSTPLPSA